MPGSIGAPLVENTTDRPAVGACSISDICRACLRRARSDQQAAAALARIDGWIAVEERCEAERRRGEKTRPSPPGWLIQHGLNGTNVDAVRTGGCWAATGSGRCCPVTRQQALEAPRQQALRQQAPTCVHCRADTALGVPG
ncbi:DUF6233 domain-containing protein [Streptomyces sp. NPDC057052]|uniref:DUF6233 domain-containing protein n=1 Tax=Streptomyces sp. NPDC057052 TaxID=3346010 RepID=UPI00363B1ADE